ncbi:hypothetical protein [Sphingomonas bacterium]|uniref:hypothetical protein n=1 Tax=Sphingomonas bacterium TaxID=1895847 RepID=UPI00157523EA|nr:hypothetical protein [Sphingomonas bacterium]
MRIISLGCLALAAMTLFDRSASAQSITYVVKQQIGQGSVAGQITTDGTAGTLAATNITAWNLALNGVGATYNITNTNSSVVVQGGATSATAQNLSFNYSTAGTNYLLFQQGLYSGTHYWCNSSAAGACAQGASVVPNSAFDSAAQFEARTGSQVLGMASGPMFVTTTDALNQSLNNLAASQKAQLITANLFSQVLLGKNEQVSCGDCGGAGATFGSLSVSAHGRKAITNELTALFGIAVGRYEEKGAFITNSYTFAGGLRYDPSTMGASRPYFELGGAVAPDQHATYQRPYMTGTGPATGIGQTKTTNMSVYARAGWVSRLTRRDELAGAISYGHSWQIQHSYAEAPGPGNPFDAQYSRGINEVNMAGVSAQYSHLFGHRLELGVDGSVSRSFGSRNSIVTTIDGFGQNALPAHEITYFEPGGRLSYRVSRRLKIDTFINATMSNQSIGISEHGGFGVNLSF